MQGMDHQLGAWHRDCAQEDGSPGPCLLSALRWAGSSAASGSSAARSDGMAGVGSGKTANAYVSDHDSIDDVDALTEITAIRADGACAYWFEGVVIPHLEARSRTVPGASAAPGLLLGAP